MNLPLVESRLQSFFPDQKLILNGNQIFIDGQNTGVNIDINSTSGLPDALARDVEEAAVNSAVQMIKNNVKSSIPAVEKVADPEPAAEAPTPAPQPADPAPVEAPALAEAPAPEVAPVPAADEPKSEPSTAAPDKEAAPKAKK